MMCYVAIVCCSRWLTLVMPVTSIVFIVSYIQVVPDTVHFYDKNCTNWGIFLIWKLTISLFPNSLVHSSAYKLCTRPFKKRILLIFIPNSHILYQIPLKIPVKCVYFVTNLIWSYYILCNRFNLKLRPSVQAVVLYGMASPHSNTVCHLEQRAVLLDFYSQGMKIMRLSKYPIHFFILLL